VVLRFCHSGVTVVLKEKCCAGPGDLLTLTPGDLIAVAWVCVCVTVVLQWCYVVVIKIKE
jgi:hypothetical protein